MRIRMFSWKLQSFYNRILEVAHHHFSLRVQSRSPAGTQEEGRQPSSLESRSIEIFVGIFLRLTQYPCLK